MSNITIIGLGSMGTAIANAIHNAGISLTIWNRSKEKIDPLIKQGITPALDILTAITASPATLICVENYNISNRLIRSEEIARFLHGRTLIQLSTGTPKEAEESASWMKTRHVHYLDGAILCGPGNIGTPTSHILLSGDETAYEKTKRILNAFKGTLRYLGPNVKTASVLDLAWLCESFGHILATLHAANLCESEGVGLDLLATIFEKTSPISQYTKVIHSNDFKNCNAPLRVWQGAISHILTQAKDTNINSAFPDLMTTLIKKAMDMGHGEEHILSVIKVLRKTNSSNGRFPLPQRS